MHCHNSKFGLIGYPLGHSYSKDHFSSKFEREGLTKCHYENFEIESIGLIDKIIRDHTDLVGLNVTIPYKQAIIPFLDCIDPVARKIAAVNTIKISRSGSQIVLKGYNTDVVGFTKSLDRWSFDKPIRALVFGTGGSSQAIKYALKQRCIDFISVSRNHAKGLMTYGAITKEIASDYKLWINCTPVGMFPGISGLLPLPYRFLTRNHYLFDLVYNPEVTGFIRQGKEAGASVMNGLVMLYEQAEASWKIWTEESA